MEWKVDAEDMITGDEQCEDGAVSEEDWEMDAYCYEGNEAASQRAFKAAQHFLSVVSADNE